MPEGKTYTIRQNRLIKAGLYNMAVKEHSLEFKGDSACFLLALDSAVESCLWGRMHAEYCIEGQISLSVCAMAFDEKEIIRNGKAMDIDDFFADDTISCEEKEKFFANGECIKSENQKDMLLYSLTGRYLWIYIAAKGVGTGKITQMKVYQKGDNFMDTFPEVYRERDSFFHRYLSIFSSIYNDFQNEMEGVYDKFNPDTAPKELLPILAGWLGIDVKGDFLEEEELRLLVKEAYGLSKRKGTKQALERVAEILLGEKAVIQERIENEKKDGSKETYDITILVNKQVEQNRKARLMHILKQFKPVKCTMRILFLKKGGNLDKHAYMDMNAMIFDGSNGILDSGQSYECIILK